MNSLLKIPNRIKNVFEREIGTEILPEENQELNEFISAVKKYENIISGYVQALNDNTIFLRPTLLLGTKIIKCINISNKELPPNNAKVRLIGYWKKIPYILNNKYYSSDIFYFDNWELLPRPKVKLPLSYEEVLEFFIEDMGIEFKDPFIGNRLLYQDALLTNSISAPPIPQSIMGGIYSSVSYLNSYKTKAQRALARIKRMIPTPTFNIYKGMRKIELKYFQLDEAKNLFEQRKLVSKRKKLLKKDPFLEISANFHLSEAKVEKFVRKKFYGDISFLLPSTLDVKKELPVLGRTLFEFRSLFSEKPKLPPNIHIPLYFIAAHINMPIINKNVLIKADKKISNFISKKTLELSAEIVGKDKLIDPNRLNEQALRLGLYIGRRKESDKIRINDIETGLNQIFTLSNKFFEELITHERSGQPRLSSVQAIILKVYEKNDSNNKGVKISEIIKELSGKISKAKVEEEIMAMIDKGIFYMPRPGIIKLP